MVIRPVDPDSAVRLADLMVRVGHGDRSAFAAIYDATSALTYGTALKVLKDRELAAEVTQEVMIEVWQKSASFSAARGQVKNWVGTLAHRRAVDRVRSVQAQRERDLRVEQQNYTKPYDDVAQSVVDSDDRRRLVSCMEHLTARQRDVIQRAYYGGRTYRQVAAELDESLPTVKSRIRDGLAGLSKCLGVRS